jgi:hypothetical protein
MSRSAAIKARCTRAFSFVWDLNTAISQSPFGRIFRLKGSGHVGSRDIVIFESYGGCDETEHRANLDPDTSPTRSKMPTSLLRSARASPPSPPWRISSLSTYVSLDYSERACVPLLIPLRPPSCPTLAVIVRASCLLTIQETAPTTPSGSCARMVRIPSYFSILALQLTIPRC